jgi:hypothetical protein
MFGFLIRKTVYDLWDNMFRIVLVNLGFIALLAVPILVPGLFESLALEITFHIVGVLCCSVYLATAALSVKSISDYGSFGFGDFFRNLKEAWPAGLVMGFLVLVVSALVTVDVRVYMSLDSLAGPVLTSFVLWTAIFALLSFQFYFAVRARLGTNLLKVFRKCLIIFFDNTGLAVFSLLHNIIALILSALLAFLFPGPCGILLFLDEALRLRILKYDWLEANPGANRRKIPWDALLIDEREKTGTRTFRNFIFPWKD